MSGARKLRDVPGWKRALASAIETYAHTGYPFELAGEIVVPWAPTVICEDIVLAAARLLQDCMTYTPRLRLAPSLVENDALQ